MWNYFTHYFIYSITDSHDLANYPIKNEMNLHKHTKDSHYIFR